MSMLTEMTQRPSSGSIQSRSLTTSDSEQRNCAKLKRLRVSISLSCLKGGTKNMDVQPGQRVKNVRCTRDTLRVDLLDGRIIIVPLAWYPRLLHATPEQRTKWKIAGGGYGIHWPDVDEDLSVEGLLRGLPAPRVGVPLPVKGGSASPGSTPRSAKAAQVRRSATTK